MGAGMAARLLHAGHALSVWNRNSARAAPLVAKGARLASSPRDAAADADVIVSMVADDAASRSIWLGADGALAGAKRGAIAIESSTLTPAWIRELADACAQGGSALLDAPVTGSRTHAAEGQLLFLVGGDSAVLDRVRGVFSAMGRGVVHLGPVGSGALLKLVNNCMCGVQAAALAEALAVIERSGLDRGQALAVLKDGAPGSPLVKGVSTRMVERDYAVHFKLELMDKDLTYAIRAAEGLGVALETATAALGAFRRAVANGYGEQDMAAVIEPMR